MQFEERERQREYDLQMERIRAETRRVEVSAQSSESANSVTGVGDVENHSTYDRMVRFKMVDFDENTADVEAFCRMFEMTAKAYKLPAEYWGIEFAKCLKGSAQEVYQRMSDEECCNYEALKDALRKRYKLTEGGYRSRFRKARCLEKEPLKDFRYRLERYFDNCQR